MKKQNPENFDDGMTQVAPKNELKTLKDMDIKPYSTMNNPEDFELDDVVSIYELKAEAVKWVKEIETDLKPYRKLQGKKVSQKDLMFVNGNIATEEWIKHFFNLTEEDLK